MHQKQIIKSSYTSFTECGFRISPSISSLWLLHRTGLSDEARRPALRKDSVWNGRGRENCDDDFGKTLEMEVNVLSAASMLFVWLKGSLYTQVKIKTVPIAEMKTTAIVMREVTTALLNTVKNYNG